MSKIFDICTGQAVDLSNLGTIIRERREALGLTQSQLALLSGLSRQTLVGLEAGALRGCERNVQFASLVASIRACASQTQASGAQSERSW